MKRAVAVAVGLLLAVGVALPAGAQEGPGAYAPVVGICLRPVLASGSLIDLPLVNVPGGSIPAQPIPLVLGGQFNDCR